MSERQKDALSEAGNVGAAYAVTALSKLVDEEILINVTECKLAKMEQFPQSLGDAASFVVGVNMLIPTENLCSILMFFPYDAAMECCDMFSKNKIGSTTEISYKEYVILAEIGNICLCAYLNALSKLINEQFIPTPPAVACDELGSLLEDVAPSADLINNNAIIVQTSFIDHNGQENGHFLFIPDRDAKDAILKVFKALI